MRRIVLLLAAALVLPACGGDDPKPRASSSPTPSPVLPSGKPVPRLPSTKPATLVQTDFIVGTGRTALPGNSVTVRYLGVHFDGTEFDASTYEPGEHPLTFLLGGDEVIKGWDQGLIGMKVGGRRQLIIPPDLAYGAEGRNPSIRPNETLVFVVDLLSVDVGIEPNNTFAPQ